MKISMKLVCQYMAIFSNFSLTSSHLRPLQVENCDSNSRLVVDEMTMVNSGLKGLINPSEIHVITVNRHLIIRAPLTENMISCPIYLINYDSSIAILGMNLFYFLLISNRKIKDWFSIFQQIINPWSTAQPACANSR